MKETGKIQAAVFPE